MNIGDNDWVDWHYLSKTPEERREFAKNMRTMDGCFNAIIGIIILIAMIGGCIFRP